ncbi:MAG: zinc-ribbon domain-containing protein [Candidatus Bathyarchaeia archaeon]
MTKKGLGVWLFSILTAIAAAHLIDAANTFLFNKPATLLRLYPVEGIKLQALTPDIYFLAAAASTTLFWGITCAVAFENPVEAFLNKILSDAKKQSAVETQLLEEKSEILDAMNETIEMNNEILSHVKDVIYNIRAEIKEIQPIKESVEKIKTELNHLKKEIKEVESKLRYPNVCVSCGKPILPEFKICPYCGEPIKIIKEQLIPLEKYK